MFQQSVTFPKAQLLPHVWERLGILRRGQGESWEDPTALGCARDAGAQGKAPLGSLAQGKPLRAAAVGAEEFSSLEGENRRDLLGEREMFVRSKRPKQSTDETTAGT